MRVFIIDDQPFSQELARRVLLTMGITEAHQFEDAEKALAELPVLKPELVLVDYEMTPMSGIEFVNRVRGAGEVWSTVPILMITGHTSPEHVRQAQTAGVDGFIVKPFSLNSLRTRIEKVLRERGGGKKVYLPD